ncbi:adaptor-related protein complex 3 beta 2 subunit, isoform CRA_c, partial [Jimgerdemannia flammicorona]
MADYISKAIQLAENAQKLSQRVSQGIVENARELGLDSASHYFDTSEEKMHDIRRQLDARNDREKLDGLKRLIAMISKGRDVSEFFPDVVKNVASVNIEIRKLVYIYLLRYAEQEPDLALLSINTFQKDLTDQNQLIRAMALRVMSGIRVPVISPIIILAIKKCVTDMSPYVRKTAAHAIPKCYSLDPAQEEALVEIIQQLLGDTSAITIGSVIMAFNEVCPERFDLIHPHYRKLLGADGNYGPVVEIWKIGSNANSTTGTKAKPKKKRTSSFYSNSDDNEEEEEASASENEDDEEAGPWVLDEDHTLLLSSCTPLLQSRNSGVVLSVAKIFYHLAPNVDAYKIGKPLARLLRTHRELQYVVLTNIATMASKRP